MGSMYRILIESGDGETVADLTAPVEMLAQFAPEAVARLLNEATPEAEGDTPTAPETPAEQKERRRRRTKAEMEAARAAEPSTPESPAAPEPEPAPMAMAGGGRGPEPEVYSPFGPK